MGRLVMRISRRSRSLKRLLRACGRGGGGVMILDRCRMMVGICPLRRLRRRCCGLGFRGWFSMEIFDGGPEGKGREYDMNEYAKKAMKSMERFLSKCATDRD